MARKPKSVKNDESSKEKKVQITPNQLFQNSIKANPDLHKKLQLILEQMDLASQKGEFSYTQHKIKHTEFEFSFFKSVLKKMGFEISEAVDASYFKVWWY